MEIRVEQTKECLKIEKIAKKELIGKLLIFFLILIYICIRLYIYKEKTAITTFIFAFLIFLCIVFYFISSYPYEVLIIKNGKIIRYVSLFYRSLKWCKAFNFLEIYSINDLKNIYFKNTTEILVSKALKRTESPYHKIHIKFKDKSYKGFGIKLKDKDAKEIVLIINKFLEKYKKEAKIKKFTLVEKENLMEKYSFLLDKRYDYILNKIIDEAKLFISEKDNNFIINGDSEAIKNLEIFKNMEWEEINFYKFYVDFLSKKENEDKIVLVGYNGVDGKEVTMSKLKDDINEIRDSKSTFKD